MIMQDPDSLARERAADCLTLIGRKANSVRRILSAGALATLLDLLQDANVSVRYIGFSKSSTDVKL